MQTVERVVADVERSARRALAASERRVTESEAKLAELETYQTSYAEQFSARAGAGIGAPGLRDFQTFMARLAEAVKQQTQVVVQARGSSATPSGRRWQSAAQRAEAVGGLVKRWQTEEQREDDRREQNESDERSQRTPWRRTECPWPLATHRRRRPTRARRRRHRRCCRSRRAVGAAGGFPARAGETGQRRSP